MSAVSWVVLVVLLILVVLYVSFSFSSRRTAAGNSAQRDERNDRDGQNIPDGSTENDGGELAEFAYSEAVAENNAGANADTNRRGRGREETARFGALAVPLKQMNGLKPRINTEKSRMVAADVTFTNNAGGLGIKPGGGRRIEIQRNQAQDTRMNSAEEMKQKMEAISARYSEGFGTKKLFRDPEMGKATFNKAEANRLADREAIDRNIGRIMGETGVAGVVNQHSSRGIPLKRLSTEQDRPLRDTKVQKYTGATSTDIVTSRITGVSVPQAGPSIMLAEGSPAVANTMRYVDGLREYNAARSSVALGQRRENENAPASLPEDQRDYARTGEMAQVERKFLDEAPLLEHGSRLHQPGGEDQLLNQGRISSDQRDVSREMETRPHYAVQQRVNGITEQERPERVGHAREAKTGEFAVPEQMQMYSAAVVAEQLGDAGGKIEQSAKQRCETEAGRADAMAMTQKPVSTVQRRRTAKKKVDVVERKASVATEQVMVSARGKQDKHVTFSSPLVYSKEN